MSKWMYKSVPALSNYFNVEWTMSLIGFMIFIGCQPGMANVCMEKGGELLLSSIYISFKAIKLHSRVGKQHLFYHYQTSIDDGDIL